MEAVVPSVFQSRNRGSFDFKKIVASDADAMSREVSIS